MAPNRTYCCVHLCFNNNSSTTKQDLSFFKLPSDENRRAQWLKLICREDLQDKPPTSYSVCESHFSPRDILPTTQRKKLKSNALPSQNLPELRSCDAACNTDLSGGVRAPYASKFIQTDRLVYSRGVQTLKMKPDVTYVKTIKARVAQKQIKDHCYMFCKQFLRKEFSKLVKEQATLKPNLLENTFSTEYREFCQNLYTTNPKVYDMFQKSMRLPEFTISRSTAEGTSNADVDTSAAVVGETYIECEIDCGAPQPETHDSHKQLEPKIEICESEPDTNDSFKLLEPKVERCEPGSETQGSFKLLKPKMEICESETPNSYKLLQPKIELEAEPDKSFKLLKPKIEMIESEDETH